MEILKPKYLLSLKKKQGLKSSSVNSVNTTMPKTKRAGDIRNKISSTESPTKKQTCITSFYTSPQKNNTGSPSSNNSPMSSPVKKSAEKIKSNLQFTFMVSCERVKAGGSTSKETCPIPICDSQSEENVSQPGINMGPLTSENVCDVIVIDDDLSQDSFGGTSTKDLTDSNFFNTSPQRHSNKAKASTSYTHDLTLKKTFAPESSSFSSLLSKQEKSSNKTNQVINSPIKIRLKPPEELLSKKDSPVKPGTGSLKKSPKKSPVKGSGKKVTPKKRSEPLSFGSPGKVVKFSPKIKQHPGKFIDQESMPEQLTKSPTKMNGRKVNFNPRKKNLMKHFEPVNTNQNRLDRDLSPRTWDAINQLVNNAEAMEEIRLNNSTSRSNDVVKVDTNAPKNVVSHDKLPSKENKIKEANHDALIRYLFLNPMFTCAEKRKVLACEEFNIMRNTFGNLSRGCQQLYTKMFERSATWFRVEADLVKKYKDIYEDVRGSIAALVQQKLITDDLCQLALLELLNFLQVSELKTVCKHFRVVSEGNATKKDNLVKALLNCALSQRVLFGSLEDKMKQHAVKELGHCVKLTENFKQMFNLLLIMATYPFHGTDEENKRLSNLIFKLNNVKFGQISFPAYIPRPDFAFQSIYHLNDYAVSLTFVAQYSNFVENKNWDAASLKVKEAIEKFKTFLFTDSNMKLLESLGGHLFKFTAGYQYCYCLSDGLSVLKKDHTDKCIEVCNLLLSQRWFLQRKRGIWYDELALLHQTRSKDLVAACEAVKAGLEDTKVNIIQKRTLSQRAATLVKRKGTTVSAELRAQLSDLMVPDSFKVPSETITAKSQEGASGRKQIFYREDDGDMIYCSVEEIVIFHYQHTCSPPFKYGKHDEGRILMNVILGCFYDVIYSHPEGPSVFHCPMQTHPLDWGGSHFYKRRKRQIEELLNCLRAGGLSEVMMMLQKVCSNSRNEISVVSWDYINIEKLPMIMELLECLGVNVFLNIAEHVIKDYKTYQSGFPDLMMWDPPSRRCVLVEVKGPNDKLSPAQKVWLENLCKFGAEALVCHVESMGSRKRKISN